MQNKKLTLSQAVATIRLEKLTRKQKFSEKDLFLEARKRYPHLKEPSKG
jgi:hypothetical protein